LEQNNFPCLFYRTHKLQRTRTILVYTDRKNTITMMLHTLYCTSSNPINRAYLQYHIIDVELKCTHLIIMNINFLNMVQLIQILSFYFVQIEIVIFL